jgi:hypothetical protein
MSVPTKLHSSARFWDVAAYFRKSAVPWIVVAGYERRHHLELQGKTGTICLKVHVLGEPADKENADGGVRFQSTVTIWPPKLTTREEALVARRGWYAAVKRLLRQHGYRGDWTRGQSLGKWGDFTKDLPSLAAVRKETAWLLKLDLGRKT